MQDPTPYVQGQKISIKPIKDGRLVHERPTMIRNNSEPNPKPWQVNMKKKLPDLKPAPDNINTFGKESNFNKTDELGPWEAKCKFIGGTEIELIIYFSIYKIRRANERSPTDTGNKSKVYIW